MNGLKRTPAQLERRNKIISELFVVIEEEFMEYNNRTENDSLLGQILDEYVYKCSESEVDELEDIIVNHYGEEE